MKKIYFLHYIFILFFTIVILLSSYIQTYNIPIITILLYFLLLFLFIYSFGILINKNEIYKKNVTFYFIIYIVFLICFTMLLKRTGIGLINQEYFLYYINKINIIPFKTIFGYIKNIGNFSTFAYNIIGNVVALIPLSIILILKDKRNESIKRQFIILSLITLSIETLQLLLCAGIFDIDDYILNVGGAILFLIIIKKFNITYNIKQLFCYEFKIKKGIKMLIYLFISILLLIFSLIITFELSKDIFNNQTDNQEKIYSVFNEECNQAKEESYNDYLFVFDCVDIFYETSDGFQMSFVEAIKNNYIDIDNLSELFVNNNFVLNDNENYYNSIENLYIYKCNKNIIFSSNKNINDKYCLKS